MSAPRRRRRERRAPRRIIVGLVLVFVFAIGIALGKRSTTTPAGRHAHRPDRRLTLAPESATVTVTAP